jgi:hypothetical protein
VRENLDATTKSTYECEVCGKVEKLTQLEAFDAGWDYPPFIGSWGEIGPRTCGSCNMMDTTWWALTVGQELTDKQRAFAERVSQENPDGT